MITQEEEDPPPPPRARPLRNNIHGEIEQILIKKLFSVVESIGLEQTGELNFKPYDSRLLIQIDGFLDKKFKQKVFREKRDKQITEFRKQLKLELLQRDFEM